MIRTVSHALLASDDVPREMRFLEFLLGRKPRFENEEFGEFVLENGFRLAVFRPVGKAARLFRADGERGTVSLGLTTDDVDALYERVAAQLDRFGASTAGPPRDHPWGQRSFLLVDPDGNRFEIAQAPEGGAMLPND